MAERLETQIKEGETFDFTLISQDVSDNNPITNVIWSAINLADNSSVNIFTDKGFSGKKIAVDVHNIIAGQKYRLRAEVQTTTQTFIEDIFITGITD